MEHNSCGIIWMTSLPLAGQPRGSVLFTASCYTVYICNRLGVPLALDKCEGPTTCIAFLGIIITTRAMEIRLPHDKLCRIKEELRQWQAKKRCTRQELQSLTGLLQHAATVVRPGRTFLRRLYDLVSTAKAPGHHLYLNTAAQADLAWWGLFIDAWNGLSVLHTRQLSHSHHVVVSDASGS